MPRRKIVIASMMHETNTFSPVPTPLEAFRPLSGEAAIAEFKHTNTQLGGFLDVAQRMGAEIVLPLAANAHPSGYVERRAYEDMCDAIVDGIRGGCDVAFLALHGAMVAEHADDGEGELLRRIRAVAPRLPIAVGLDFHTQLTSAMVENATVITGYRTYPHIDMAETAQRAATTLVRARRRGAAGDGLGHPPDAHQHARAHALTSADEGRDGHGDRRRSARCRSQRVGARGLSAVRHPASVVLGGRRVRW